MKAKLDTTLFYVKNVELIKNFYVENFDFQVIEEDSVWALLHAGSSHIAFHKIGEEYLKQISEDHQFDNNTKLIFETDTDIVSARNELISKNIRMREIKTFDHYDFWLCDGLDPEGNVFQLKSRKVTNTMAESGPFYHGTKADLKIGDFLTAGFESNYKDRIIMNHIYFTALENSAGLAAALAKGDSEERIYIIEPTGTYENDPNVTDKKFPGNPTRSFRSQEPVKIVGEIKEWIKLSDEELQKWRDNIIRLKNNPDAKIIN